MLFRLPAKWLADMVVRIRLNGSVGVCCLYLVVQVRFWLTCQTTGERRSTSHSEGHSH